MFIVFLVFVLAIAGGILVHMRLWHAPAKHRSFGGARGLAMGSGLFDIWRRSVVPLLLAGIAVAAGAVVPKRG